MSRRRKERKRQKKFLENKRKAEEIYARLRKNKQERDGSYEI